MIRTKNDSRYNIDYDRKVFVYKNLHKDCWSIRQDGLVKAHSDGSPISIYSASKIPNSFLKTNNWLFNVFVIA